MASQDLRIVFNRELGSVFFSRFSLVSAMAP
jgi:hypothetical protein